MMRTATIFSSRKPSAAAMGSRRAGWIISFIKEETMVGRICFMAFFPSKPAPRPIRASGVARTEILLKVLPSMEGMGSRIRDASMPRAMPMIMGLVRMPLTGLLQGFLSPPEDGNGK